MNHEVFRGKGSAQELRRKMREAVDREYPDAEKEKTESERQGTIPPSIMALLRDTREAEEEEQADRGPARKR